jgi:hypothetical protein
MIAIIIINMSAIIIAVFSHYSYKGIEGMDLIFLNNRLLHLELGLTIRLNLVIFVHEEYDEF